MELNPSWFWSDLLCAPIAVPLPPTSCLSHIPWTHLCQQVSWGWLMTACCLWWQPGHKFSYCLLCYLETTTWFQFWCDTAPTGLGKKTGSTSTLVVKNYGCAGIWLVLFWFWWRSHSFHTEYWVVTGIIFEEHMQPIPGSDKSGDSWDCSRSNSSPFLVILNSKVYRYWLWRF